MLPRLETIRWLAMLDALLDPWNSRFNPDRYITNLTAKGHLGPVSFKYSQLSDENKTRAEVLAIAPLSILSRALVDGAVGWTETSSSNVLIQAAELDSTRNHRPWKQPFVSLDCYSGHKG
jgi:hypothetical protein